jgi:NAD(P)-dependent dehydrogenase (short-subunit alcohol dehydrogenase family)
MQTTKDRIALVTGANKGIGFEIARQLGKEGNRILIGARDRDRGQTAVADLRSEGFAARYVQIDLTELATITGAAADIEAQEGRLDILINNAGITSLGDGSPGAASLEAVRRTFDTNFFGTLAVTQAMFPLLKRSTSGRIVNLSNGLGSLTQIGDPKSEFSGFRFIGYGASKAALNMLTVQLAAELKTPALKSIRSTPVHGHRSQWASRSSDDTRGSRGRYPCGPSAGRWPHRRLLQREPSPAMVGH